MTSYIYEQVNQLDEYNVASKIEFMVSHKYKSVHLAANLKSACLIKDGKRGNYSPKC